MLPAVLVNACSTQAKTLLKDMIPAGDAGL